VVNPKKKPPEKLLGYYLMTNQFQLLLSPVKAEVLSKYMQ